MRKISKAIAQGFFFALLLSTTVFANNVSDIDIDITLRDDGSAYIVQEWQGSFSEKTENYIPINTDGIEITDYKVSDEDGEYTHVKEWDIDASFSQKARKYGINQTHGGVELCFGISEYGQKHYTIEYVVQGFVKSYTDYDGTNFMLVNPGMSTFPSNCTVSISLENGILLSQENSAIWAFGFEGYIEFRNGEVVASTTQALRDNNRVIVMLRLDKGIITPVYTEVFSFENVMNKAFEGSDYGKEKDSVFVSVAKMFLFALLFVVVIALVIIFIVKTIKRKRAIRKFYSEADYYRDIPNGGNLKMSHFLSQRFDIGDKDSLIIGAVMLSMINRGEISPLTEESVGFFGNTKESVSLKLIKEPEDKLSKKLYELMQKAAGKDGVLQEKELSKYTYNHPQKLRSFIDYAIERGEDEFCLLPGFLSYSGNKISDLTDIGKKELSEIMGLKKYLEEFSLISERGVKEAEIWQEYMVYAMLFGIADKVEKQLRQVYPEMISELESYDRNIIICHSYYHTMYSSYTRSVQQSRSSGLGGSSSLGGGGGFSGGGFGGGSR